MPWHAAIAGSGRRIIRGFRRDATQGGNVTDAAVGAIERTAAFWSADTNARAAFKPWGAITGAGVLRGARFFARARGRIAIVGTTWLLESGIGNASAKAIADLVIVQDVAEAPGLWRISARCIKRCKFARPGITGIGVATGIHFLVDRACRIGFSIENIATITIEGVGALFCFGARPAGSFAGAFAAHIINAES